MGPIGDVGGRKKNTDCRKKWDVRNAQLIDPNITTLMLSEDLFAHYHNHNIVFISNIP